MKRKGWISRAIDSLCRHKWIVAEYPSGREKTRFVELYFPALDFAARLIFQTDEIVVSFPPVDAMIISARVIFA